MKNLIKYGRFVLIAAIAVGLTATGCNRSKDSLGNGICPSAGFTVSLGDLTFNGMNAGVVDLSVAGLNVVANFQESIKWTLTIEATDGSADKTYTGEGKKVNVWWYGNSRKEPIFKAGPCKLTFKVQCRDAITKDFTLQGASNFQTLAGTYGALVRDWDFNGLRDVATHTPTFAGVDGYAYGDDASKSSTWTYVNTDPSPAGGYYGRIDGASKSSNPLWYFGGVSVDGLSTNAGSPLNKLSTTNPDSIWLNMYIKSGIGLNTEADVSLGKTTTVKWNLRKAVDWDGWKMVSVRLSDLISNDGTVLTTSMDIKTIDLQLGSVPLQSLTNHIEYDFVIFTVGGPFFDE